MNDSKKFTIGLKDILHGIAVAALTPVAFIFQQSIDAGSLHIDPKTTAMAALAGGVAYVIKKFFNGSNNQNDITK